MTKDDFSKDHENWQDWKPVWTITPKSKKRKKKPTPQTIYDFQERHSPTEPVNIRLSHLRQLQKSHRRLCDARLWDAMTCFQQNAALELDFSFKSLSRGLGYNTSNPDRLPSGSIVDQETKRDIEMMSLYFKWAEECAKNRLQHSATIDVVSFGKTCRQVDRERRVRKGWSRTNLFDCLTLYCKIKGWPTS